jgi:hypothetical protein
MIDHTKKMIFVHIPKNAGESIEKCLGGYGDKKKLWGIEKGVVLQHLKACELQEKIGDQVFNDYFKFTFVRNPFSKCLSEYFWEKTYLNESLNFNDWVKLKLGDLINQSENNTTTLRQKHNLEQYKFIYDASDNCLVDFIGRFEKLQEDFDLICDKIGVPRQQLPHKNKSKHKHYTEYYEDEIREIVEKKYEQDIEYFGYEFGT